MTLGTLLKTSAFGNWHNEFKLCLQTPRPLLYVDAGHGSHTHTGSRRKGLHVTLHSSPYFWETHSRLFEHLVLIAYFCNKNMKIFFQNGLKLVCFEILEISTHKREKEKKQKKRKGNGTAKDVEMSFKQHWITRSIQWVTTFYSAVFFAGQKTVSQSAI